MGNIACLMVIGGMISSDIANTLYSVGRDLIANELKGQSFKTDEAEGYVTTERKYGVLGHINGYICDAEIDTIFHPSTIKARYIVSPPYIRDEDLDKGAWMGRPTGGSYEQTLGNLDRAMNAHNN